MDIETGTLSMANSSIKPLKNPALFRRKETCYTVDWEIFVVNRFSSITFNNENSTYKWTKFILSSGHSDENKATQKFHQRNILAMKNF